MPALGIYILPKSFSLLYFVRSGLININASKLWGLGQNSDAWASASHPNAIYAYLFVFDSGGANPSDYNNRWYAFPLRCLAS